MEKRIYSKKILKEYLNQDAKANRRFSIRPKFIGDRIWKFIRSMRYLEYYSTLVGTRRIVILPAIIFHRLRFDRLSLQLGYSIPLNVFGKGFAIAHVGTIVVNGNAIIGDNCRIHDGVTIGSTSGSGAAPHIGNNVFLATGAKIIGDISIADDVSIGANAVVVKSIEECGTTWGGVPAHKISNNNSHKCLSPLLNLD